MSIAHLPALLDAALAPLPAGPVVVGFSGGLDSSVLLHALAASPAARTRGLRAVHIDHGLQADSARWSAHCLREAARLGVPCVTHRVALDDRRGQGIEGAAREARYRAFEHELAAGGLLALAHHRDDQAETVLLRLLRQAGAEALAGMRPLRPLAPGAWLWRPLLEQSRSDLQHYAQQHGLCWIDDPSNADCSLDRNFLRHQVLPLLAKRWPQASAALAGSAGHLAAAADELHRLDRQRLALAQGLDPHTLRTDPLRTLSRDGLGRVLRLFCRDHGLPLPPLAIVERVWQRLQQQSTHGLQLEWAGVVLSGYRDLLHLRRIEPAMPAFQLPWDGIAPLRLPDGGCLRLEPDCVLPQAWTVRNRHGGERLQLPHRAHRSTLQHALQEAGIPPWERHRLPLLLDRDGQLLAAGDLLISQALDAQLRREGRRLRWLPAAENSAEPGHTR